MDPNVLLTQLSDICDDLDAHRPLCRPSFALPAAALLLMGVTLSACGEKEDTGVPHEDCTNGEDDDGDERIDCADDDCSSDPGCMDVPAYAAPME